MYLTLYNEDNLDHFTCNLSLTDPASHNEFSRLLFKQCPTLIPVSPIIKFHNVVFTTV